MGQQDWGFRFPGSPTFQSSAPRILVLQFPVPRIPDPPGSRSPNLPVLCLQGPRTPQDPSILQAPRTPTPGPTEPRPRPTLDQPSFRRAPAGRSAGGARSGAALSSAPPPASRENRYKKKTLPLPSTKAPAAEAPPRAKGCGRLIFQRLPRLRGLANLPHPPAGSGAARRRKSRALHFVARYGGGARIGAGMRHL